VRGERERRREKKKKKKKKKGREPGELILSFRR
jgi:hypothetical protein